MTRCWNHLKFRSHHEAHEGHPVGAGFNPPLQIKTFVFFNFLLFVAFVVKSIFLFGCGSAALGLSWRDIVLAEFPAPYRV
jgi:hypothetical protein